jgi:hypothetical protein
MKNVQQLHERVSHVGDAKAFTFKINKLQQVAAELAMHFGSHCLQSIYKQMKVMPALATTVSTSHGPYCLGPRF